MAVVNTISEQEYRELALNDTDGSWELWDGVPRKKPLMSVLHDGVSAYLGFLLQDQLDRREYRVNINGGKARLSARDYFVPDVVVIPAAYQAPYQHDPHALNAYAEPLPLLCEVWSLATSPYDFETKLAGYRERGDAEIWFIHPYQRTLTIWRRRDDGSYTEAVVGGGVVAVSSLPGVAIDFDALLDG